MRKDFREKKGVLKNEISVGKLFLIYFYFSEQFFNVRVIDIWLQSYLKVTLSPDGNIFWLTPHNRLWFCYCLAEKRIVTQWYKGLTQQSTSYTLDWSPSPVTSLDPHKLWHGMMSFFLYWFVSTPVINTLSSQMAWDDSSFLSLPPVQFKNIGLCLLRSHGLRLTEQPIANVTSYNARG